MTEPTKHGRQASRNAYAIRNQNRKPSKEDAAARFAAAASGDPLLAENSIPNKNAGNVGGEESSSGGLRRTRSEDFTFPSMDKVDKPAVKEEKKDSAKEKDNAKESTKEPQQQHRGKSEPRGPPSVRDKAGTMIIGRKYSMDERQYRVRSEGNVEAPKEEQQARDKDHRRDTAKGNESRVRRRADSGTSLGSSGRRPTIEGRASIVLVDLFNVVIAPADSLGMVAFAFWYCVVAPMAKSVKSFLRNRIRRNRHRGVESGERSCGGPEGNVPVWDGHVFVVRHSWACLRDSIQ